MTKCFRAITIGAVLCFINVHAAETVVIFDPLLGSTLGTQIGGSFSAEGFRPGGNGTNGNFSSAHILYGFTLSPDGGAIQREGTSHAQQAPIPEGYVEFEMKGMDLSTVPADGDVGFLGMYDGRGIAEPCQYFDDFKQNFFRWNMHWRNNRKAFKAVISCANATPERITASKAVYPSARDWSTEPTGSGLTWNSTKWYTVRVEWKGTAFKVFVDGVQKWSASGPNGYAPIRHRIWLGSAPGYGDKYTAMVPELTYRNFKLVALRATDVTGNEPPRITSFGAAAPHTASRYVINIGPAASLEAGRSLSTTATHLLNGRTVAIAASRAVTIIDEASVRPQWHHCAH